MTANDPTQALRRPIWNGPTDAFPVVSSPVPVRASMPEPVQTPPTRYTPVGEAKYQLSTANAFIGMAVVLAFLSILGAKLFDLHPAGYYYGYLWVGIGLATCAGFNSPETYTTEAAAWKASGNKMMAAGVSAVCTLIVWLLVWYMLG